MTFNQKAYSRSYYLANKEKWQRRTAEWKRKNPEKVKAGAKRYRAKNRDELNRRERARRLAAPEKLKQQRAKYNKDNWEMLKKKKQNWYKASKQKLTDPSRRIAYLAWMAGHRSKKTGYVVEPGFADDLIAVPPKSCACCQYPLDYSMGNGRNPLRGPSIDRVNNKLGYLKSNVAILCRGCNTIKRDKDVNTFLQIVEYIQNHHINSFRLVG